MFFSEHNVIIASILQWLGVEYYKNKSLLVDDVCTVQALFVTKPLHYRPSSGTRCL